jgi:hypothetical protein
MRPADKWQEKGAAPKARQPDKPFAPKAREGAGASKGDWQKPGAKPDGRTAQKPGRPDRDDRPHAGGKAR